MRLSLFLAASACFAADTHFDISYPKTANAGPITGRVYVMISRATDREPRLQVGRVGIPFFGRDIEKLQPGQAAVIDASDLGSPVVSLPEIPAGEYQVQAFINVYSEFKRADGHTVWMHDDKWEGQHWNRSPGNLYSVVKKMTLDGTKGYRIALNCDQVIPPIPFPADTEWVKRFRIQSTLLTKFWGRPIYLGATVLLPRDYDKTSVAYPVLYSQGHFSTAPPDGISDRARVRQRLGERQFSAHAGGDVPASGALFRRFLRRQFGEPGSLWRRDHAGTDPGNREAISDNQAALGAIAGRWIDRRLGGDGAGDIPPGLFRRDLGLLPGFAGFFGRRGRERLPG